VNVKQNVKLYRAFYRQVTRGLIASAISVRHRGLAIALAKTSMGGLLGLDIKLHSIPGTASTIQSILWNESQGRIVATVAPGNKNIFEKGLKNIPYACIGTVTKNNVVTIKENNNSIITECTLNDMLKSYRKPFENY
jgi:phosphoribosylformylglycinamidine (FGAM) synthase-like enzyme